MKELNIEIVAINESVGDYEARVCTICGTEFEVGEHFMTGEEMIVSPCSCYECEEGDVEDIPYEDEDKIEDDCDKYYTFIKSIS